MKDIFLLFALLIIGCSFSSCNESVCEHEDQFEKSYDAWLAFKARSNNSYTYTTKASTWVGTTWETTITVVNGKITQRSFRHTEIADGIELYGDLEWVEKEGEINSYDNTPAFEALTLDDVYEKAQENWLVRREGAKVSFEAQNDGMISLCGYAPDNSEDDNFKGVRIVDIKILEQKI